MIVDLWYPSAAGYRPAMDVKDTYIVPVDLDLYSMLLSKEKKKKC